jgi:hypothetical protein
MKPDESHSPLPRARANDHRDSGGHGAGRLPQPRTPACWQAHRAVLATLHVAPLVRRSPWPPGGLPPPAKHTGTVGKAPRSLPRGASTASIKTFVTSSVLPSR